MKSITIHKIEDETEEVLVARAREEGLSLNQLIKRLLRESLGVSQQKADHRGDFSTFCGKWSEEEAAEFDKAVEDFGQVDDELWQD